MGDNIEIGVRMVLCPFPPSIFWQNLSPNGGGEPPADLLAAINRDFGSLDNLKTQLSASTVAVQGSGWGWLGLDKASKKLKIATCANQDPLGASLF